MYSHICRHFFTADSYKYMIVGLLWGVTNPLLRQGAMRSFGPCSSMHHYHTISTATEQQDDSSDGQASDPQPESALTTLKRALLNWKVRFTCTQAKLFVSLDFFSSFYSSP